MGVSNTVLYSDTATKRTAAVTMYCKVTTLLVRGYYHHSSSRSAALINVLLRSLEVL
jgi:hypothetical protein